MYKEIDTHFIIITLICGLHLKPKLILELLEHNLYDLSKKPHYILN